MYSGALDRVPWEIPDGGALSPELLAFSSAFDAWTVGAAPARVATYEGLQRVARGRDTALLDLAPLAGRRIAVADTEIEGFFSAKGLARALHASKFALRTKTRFEAVTVPGVLDDGELGIPAFDVAAIHDGEGRVARLAECLRKADAGADAWLVGPWLGTTVGPAEALRETLGRPVGETTSPPGGAAGARFDSARDALFEQLGVEVRRELVSAVTRAGAGFRVEGASGSFELDAVVLAIGGIAGGGIATGHGAGTLSASLAAPLRLGLGGELLDAAGTGSDWLALGLSALERAGVLTSGATLPGAPGIFVAGDAVADAPRTALGAAQSGIDAAVLATRP